MDKLNIEFKLSNTGSYSPWHLDIANEFEEIPLIITADMCWFVKIGEDIYKPLNYYTLYQHFCMLEEKNDNGELTDEEVLKEIDDIVNGKNKKFILHKCMPLDEFRNELIKSKKKQDERKGTHTTSI